MLIKSVLWRQQKCSHWSTVQRLHGRKDQCWYRSNSNNIKLYSLWKLCRKSMCCAT